MRVKINSRRVQVFCHSEHLCSSSAKDLVFRSFVAKNAPQDDDQRKNAPQDDDQRKNAPQDDDQRNNAPQDDGIGTAMTSRYIVILRERSDRRIQILRPFGAQDDDQRKNAPQDDDNIIVILSRRKSVKHLAILNKMRSFGRAALSLRMTQKIVKLCPWMTQKVVILNEAKRSEESSKAGSFGMIALGVVVSALTFFFTAGILYAQNADEGKEKEKMSAMNAEVPTDEDNSVIETDIELDQMKFNSNSDDRRSETDLDKGDRTLAPGRLQIKEDRIVIINQSLKKMIEENEKLLRQNRDLDTQVRDLRGQRNIDTTRAGTIAVERDAYKSQNEIMNGLTHKYAEDIEVLKNQLKEKEVPIAPAPQGQTLSTAAPQEIGLGTISVAQEDKEKGQDILRMLDDVQQKSRKLKTDQAKVYYNMGNRFFKHKEFSRAKDQFESALKLAPENASAHFFLAFVSSEYFNDYKTAIDHYKEYLELDPAADDAPLVREKIVEAELFLRSQIPSSLEKEMNKEKNRMY